MNNNNTKLIRWRDGKAVVFRLSPEQHKLLKEVSAIRFQSVSAFSAQVVTDAVAYYLEDLKRPKKDRTVAK